MRRIILLFTVAAMMAVLLSISAGPASALVIGGDNDGRKFDNNDNGLFIVSNDNDWWDDDDDDFDFFGNHGFDFDDGEVSLGLGDVENESGDIELDNEFSVGGNNNNACLGQQQFTNTGNFTNQQAILPSGGVFVDDDDNDRDHDWNWWNRDRGHNWNWWHHDDDDNDRWWDDDDDRDRVFFGGAEADDIEFSGPEVSFAPSNETSCEQDVEQAAAASSLGWW